MVTAHGINELQGILWQNFRRCRPTMPADCICRRLFSRRSRTDSSHSAWLNTPGGPSPASISARRTHSRRAVPVRSRCLAVCAMLRPPARTSLTASALNYGVNCRRFLFTMSNFRCLIAPSEASTKAGELPPRVDHSINPRTKLMSPKRLAT